MYGRLYRIKPNLISFELQWGLPEWEKAKFRGHVRLQKRKVFAPLCVWRVKAKPLKWLTGSHLTFNFLCFSTLPISFHLSDFEVVCLFLLLSLSPIILSFLCPRLLLASAHCPLYRFTLDFWSSFSLCSSLGFSPSSFFFISSHIRSILMPLSLRVAVHFIVLKVQRGSIIALAQNKMICLFHLCMTDPPWWNEIIYKNNLLLNYGPLPISASDTLQL